MKRVINILTIGISLIIGLSSCDNVNVDKPVTGIYNIEFSDALTKTYITSDNLNEFIVWGETSLGSADIFNMVKVTSSVVNGQKTWTYDGDKYWQDNTTYDFFAVAPIELSDKVEYHEDKGWGVEYNISGSMIVDEQVDFIFANKQITTGKISEMPEKVQLDFKHKLSKVNLKLKKSESNQDETMQIKEVYLYGMKGNGVYYLNTGWVYGSDAATVSLVGINETLSTSYTKLGEFLMLPQELSNIYLIATFDYTINGVTTSRVQIAQVPVTEVSRWEESKTYTYNAVLSVEHDIVFEGPTIQNWFSHTEGGTIIIK